MKKSFKQYIEDQSLIEPKSRLLLAVSGGGDSMVMLHLFNACGYNFAVAHCNFHLRGQEADADEALVRETCKTLGVEFFVKHFQTTEYAANNNISIQVAARELRYGWFSDLCNEKGFASVAIAHNKNDVAETVLFNLTRGAGLKGLTGIKSKSNNIIRPLLFAYRHEIEEYAAQHAVAYRNDSSNAQTKYARNRIRHNVLPELQEINPAAIDNIYSTSLHLANTWQAIEAMNADFRARVRSEVPNEIHYCIEELIKYPFRQLFLIEELASFGFSPAAVIDIEKSLYSQPGKKFYSSTHRLVRDREVLIVSQAQISTEKKEVKIDEAAGVITEPIALSFSVVSNDSDFTIPKSSDFAALDYTKLQFPLTLRQWREGDWFIPFGMKGRKKISDFLVDQKVPLHRKDSVYVLESNGDIVWVVGFRVDDRYKLEDNYRRVFLVERV
jgi:tRNA(Ile)-lysidine synthase